MADQPNQTERREARLFGVEGYGPPAGGRALALTARDGVQLRAAFWPARAASAKGTVSVLTGRAEFIEKYYECVEELLQRGFAVAALDWRGQGGSQRELSDPRKGHVDDFSLFELDIEAFEKGVLEPLAPRPWFGLAHSMGATACLLASRDEALPFERLVACGPLIEVYALERARGVKALAAGLDAIGLGASFIPAGGPKNAMLKPFAGNRLTGDALRYARNAELTEAFPDLAIGDVTIGWIAAAFRAFSLLARPESPRRIGTPTLALLAGADRVVSSRAAENFFARMKAGQALIIPEARHEILMERDAIRAQFWAAFDAFIPGS